jgi:hypothetical protein
VRFELAIAPALWNSRVAHGGSFFCIQGFEADRMRLTFV